MFILPNRIVVTAKCRSLVRIALFCR
jgi:hypothetical protein